MKSAFQAILSVALLLAFPVAPARADQIDGKWCSMEGELIEVAFTDVTTLGGNAVKANYDRHHIDFVIPKGEKHEGMVFSADQLNHEQIRVTVIGDNGTGSPSEIWEKCQTGVS